MCRSELEQEKVHTSEVKHLSISRKKKRVFVTATGLLLSAQHMHLAEYKRPRAFYLSRTNASGGGYSGVPNRLLHENLVAIMDTYINVPRFSVFRIRIGLG